jgi:hypothetical protein
MSLAGAAELISKAQQAAMLRGDTLAADRLSSLVLTVEHEREYEHNLDLGYDVVQRRTDAPGGASLGWFVKNDTHTRAARRALGLSVPDVDSLRGETG